MAKKINLNWESESANLKSRYSEERFKAGAKFYKTINLNSESSVENEVDSRVPSSSTAYKYKGYTIYWEKNRTYLIFPNGEKFYTRRIVPSDIIKLYIDDPSSSQILWRKQETESNLKGFKGDKFYEAGYLYHPHPRPWSDLRNWKGHTEIKDIKEMYAAGWNSTCTGAIKYKGYIIYWFQDLCTYLTHPDGGRFFSDQFLRLEKIKECIDTDTIMKNFIERK